MTEDDYKEMIASQIQKIDDLELEVQILNSMVDSMATDLALGTPFYVDEWVARERERAEYNVMLINGVSERVHEKAQMVKKMEGKK